METDGDGWTPLHQAATLGHEAAVRSSLEAGANPNARDGAGGPAAASLGGRERP